MGWAVFETGRFLTFLVIRVGAYYPSSRDPSYRHEESAYSRCQQGSKLLHAPLHCACRCFAVHVAFYSGCTTVHVAQSTTKAENSEPVEK